MQILWSILVALGGVVVGLAAGILLSSVWAEQAEAVNRNQHYTDQARTCLEAAALLRSKMPDAARMYLERHALASVRGIPMGRAYDELSPDSQSLLVTARRYDATFDDVDLELDRLTRNDVPADHPQLSLAIRSVTHKAEL